MPTTVPQSPHPPGATPAVEQHEPERPARCTNCDAVVTGDYCSACGQAVKYHLHSFRELFSEVTEVLTHSDSRLWRTLRALLFRPGFLTQQFLAGRRASYLSPFRLYFVMSVVFFLVVSIDHTDKTPAKAAAPTSTAPYAPEGGAQSSIRRSPGSDDPPATLDNDRRAERPDSPLPSGSISKVPSSAEEDCEHAVGHSLIPGANKLREPFIAACIKSQADHGRELRESFIHNLGRAMFVLLPLMAAFMKLLYWRPAYSYVTHLLLLLHFQAFVFLLLSIVLAVQPGIPLNVAGPLVPLLLIGWVPYYLYRSMRLVYGETKPWSLFKCSTVLVLYLVCGVCTILLAGLYSVARLLNS